MNLTMDLTPGKKYTKKTKQAMAITENWLLNNFCCPFCNSKLIKYQENNICADFYCKKCNEDFELKSKNGKFSASKITGSAYQTTIDKINSDNNSNWILLEHDNYKVKRIVFIPRYFFYDNVVEPRNKLSEHARRAGWQGCRINLNLIPSFGKICYLNDAEEIDQKIISYRLKQAEKLKKINPKEKTWRSEVLYLIDKIPDSIFTLKQLKKEIPALEKEHPENKNIDSKIRQMLQELRDKGFIIFLDKGLYQKLF